MKLHEKEDRPTVDGIYLAVNNTLKMAGFVGVVEYKDGKWFDPLSNQEYDKDLEFKWLEQI